VGLLGDLPAGESAPVPRLHGAIRANRTQRHKQLVRVKVGPQPLDELVAGGCAMAVGDKVLRC